MLVLLLAAWPVSAAPRPSCLGCHPVHFARLGSCPDCHRGEPRSSRLPLAHKGLVPARYAWAAVPGSAAVAQGKQLTRTYACRRCHVIAGSGNRLAANLDAVAAVNSPDEIARAIATPARLMPDFRLPDGSVRLLVTYLLANGRRQPANRPETPQVVHFQATPVTDNVFTRLCGDCHQLLTRSLGGLGTGSVGPNLSGLFTAHYPATAAGEQPWTAVRLQQWLENPRRSRNAALMRPVSLSAPEKQQLVALFGDVDSTPAIFP